MDSLYLLIPLSSVLVLAILGVFAWALQGGQFEDLEGEATRILGPEAKPLDMSQAVSAVAIEESAGTGRCTARGAS